MSRLFYNVDVVFESGEWTRQVLVVQIQLALVRGP